MIDHESAHQFEGDVPHVRQMIEDAQTQLEASERPVDQLFKFGRAALEQSEWESDTGYDTLFADAPEPLYRATSDHGDALVMMRDNTVVIEFPKYPQYNHVLHAYRGDNQQRNYCFWQQTVPRMYDEIKQQGFNAHTLVRPTREQHQYWMQCQLAASGVDFAQ